MSAVLITGMSGAGKSTIAGVLGPLRAGLLRAGLLRAGGSATLFVCGGADNQLELADRFRQVFPLELDEPTMLARIDAAAR
jgi:hypothetical protein